MIFKNIKLKNFRQYRDIKIEFNDKINLIEAGNGVGKSTLMASIIFALYGIEELKKSDLIEVDHDKPLYNIEYLNNNSNDGSIVEVILELEMPNNRSYQIHRRYDVLAKEDSTEALLIADNGLQTAVTNEEVISLVPREIIPLLFFDGERVKTIEDSFSKTTGDFNSEVEKILKINTYNNAKNFIKQCRQHLLTNHNFENPELNIIEKEIEQLEENLAYYENLVEENNDLLNELDNKVSYEKEKLKEYEDVRNNIDKYEDLIKQKELVDVEKNTFLFKARKQLVVALPDIVRISLFEKILQSTQEEVSREGIRGIEQSAIDIIIEKQKCICGTDLTDQLVYNLREFRKSLPPESFQTVLSYSLGNKDEELEGLRNSVVDHSAESIKKVRQSRKLSNEITDLHEQIRNKASQDEIVKLSQSLEEHQREIGSTQQKITTFETAIKKLQSTLDKKKSLQDRYMKQEEKAKLETMVVKLFEDSEEKLSSLISSRKIEMREKMEKKVNEIANELLFDEIEIRLHKNLTPQNYQLKNGSRNLSTGQKVNVSLAYLFALMEISKTDLEYGVNDFSSELHPIILDGVTATLDDEHTKKVIEHIMNFQGQTIIFANTKEVKQYEKGLNNCYKKFRLSRGKNDNYVTVEVEDELY